MLLTSDCWSLPGVWGWAGLCLPAGLLRPHARGVQEEDGREQRQKWAERQEEEEALLHPLMAEVSKAQGRRKSKKQRKESKETNNNSWLGQWVGTEPNLSGSHVTLLHTNSPNTLSVDQLAGRTADDTIPSPARLLFLGALIFNFFLASYTRVNIDIYFFCPCLTTTFKTNCLTSHFHCVCFPLSFLFLFFPGFASSSCPECVTSDILVVAQSIRTLRLQPHCLCSPSKVAATFITIIISVVFFTLALVKSVSPVSRGRTKLLVVAVLHLQVYRPGDEWAFATAGGGG